MAEREGQPCDGHLEVSPGWAEGPASSAHRCWAGARAGTWDFLPSRLVVVSEGSTAGSYPDSPRVEVGCRWEWLCPEHWEPGGEVGGGQSLTGSLSLLTPPPAPGPPRHCCR